VAGKLTTDRLLALHGSVEQLWVKMLLTLFSDTIRESSHRSYIQRYPPVQSSEMSESRTSNATSHRENVPAILNRISRRATL
jgi:hypothetical protein